ncbi:hypothetical protein NJ56_12180 [Yersinia ruckeri]|nr:hypothetical protein NJ56_12180 [Yersinia ruckeri]
MLSVATIKASRYCLARLANSSSQVAPDYLSLAFSTLRDQVGVGSKLPFEQRPTFHEIIVGVLPLFHHHFTIAKFHP